MPIALGVPVPPELPVLPPAIHMILKQMSAACSEALAWIIAPNPHWEPQ